MENQRIINEEGIIGTGEGLVNQNSKDFRELKRLIKKRASEFSALEIMQNQLLSLKLRMQTYVNKESPGEVIHAGKFLEEFLDVLNIKKKIFAEYIDYKESNLSAILKGKRKINIDLAIKFGEIFKVDPSIWLHIQNKNDLLEVMDRDKEKYKKYSLEALLEEID